MYVAIIQIFTINLQDLQNFITLKIITYADVNNVAIKQMNA